MTNTDQLREAVRRFCRSEQAADNLVAFIEQYTANAVRAARIDELKQTIFNGKGADEITVYKFQIENRIKALNREEK